MGQTEKLLQKYDVDVVSLTGTYVRNPASRRVIILDGAGSCSVEEYARRHFHRLGYGALLVENKPIRVLFSVLMWPVIQDAKDPHNRMVGFGDRHAFDAGVRGKPIWTHLPADFGTQGYGVRRAEAIKKHLSAMNFETRQLQRLFDLWLGPSEDLRQYLCTHMNHHIEVARQLINILPAVAIAEILRYLVDDYWGRY